MKVEPREFVAIQKTYIVLLCEDCRREPATQYWSGYGFDGWACDDCADTRSLEE